MRKRHLLEMSQSEPTNSNNQSSSPSPPKEVKRARTMSSSSEAETDAGRRRGLWRRCYSWFGRKKVATSDLLNTFRSWRLNNDNREQENQIPQNNAEILDDFPANTRIARHIKKGFALIINNHEFEDLTVTKREGTIIDEKRFRKVIENFGFTVLTLRDGKVDDVYKKVEQAATMDHSEHDCILVLVSTHGHSGGILHANDKLYNVHDVWSPFLNNTNLNHLPKIFIFQACRGHSSDLGRKLGPLENTRSTSARNDAVNGHSSNGNGNTSNDNLSMHSSSKTSISEIIDAEMDSNVSTNKQVTAPVKNELHPNYPNILMAYSTVEDYYSWRDPSKGTYYVQSLCSVLEQGDDRDLVSLLTRVHRDVASKSPSRAPTTFHDREYLKQAPSLTSSLTYKIFLHKKSN